MSTELMTELLEAGVHFGHQTKRWNPKMKPFIFEKRNAIYLINLGTTVKQLQQATQFLGETVQRGGKVLFVGCKKQAQEAIKEAALAAGQFYVNQRWLGRHPHESRDDPQEHRAPQVHRGHRKSP